MKRDKALLDVVIDRIEKAIENKKIKNEDDLDEMMFGQVPWISMANIRKKSIKINSYSKLMFYYTLSNELQLCIKCEFSDGDLEVIWIK